MNYIVLHNNPSADSRLQLTLLYQADNGTALYGLEYPGFWNCTSWCYLTIAKDVVIATQPLYGENTGTSITNIWSSEFFRNLSELPPVKAAIKEGIRWFEHYDRQINRPKFADRGGTLDEVFNRRRYNGDNTDWQPIAEGNDAVARFFEAVTGEPMPDFPTIEWGWERMRAADKQSS
jgi:hypothetical protein